MKGFYSKKKNQKKKQLKIIANKFNNHSSIQQSKHYKLQNKTTKNIIKIPSPQSQKWACNMNYQHNYCSKYFPMLEENRQNF